MVTVARTDPRAVAETVTDPELPTTSQPSAGDFVACYEPLVRAGHDVLSIHIASGLSGTCASAREAAGLVAEAGHPGRVEVLDSQTGAGGSFRSGHGRDSPPFSASWESKSRTRGRTSTSVKLSGIWHGFFDA